MLKFSKKKTIVILLLTLILIVTFAVVYFVIPQVTKNNESMRLPDDAIVIEQEEADSLSELKSILDFETDYWADWSWETKFMEFKIEKVNTIDDYVTGYIRRPDILSNNMEPALRHPVCNPEKTIAVSKDSPLLGVVADNFSLMTRASEGDILYTKCLDSDCLNVGENCILVEF